MMLADVLEVVLGAAFLLFLIGGGTAVATSTVYVFKVATQRRGSRGDPGAQVAKAGIASKLTRIFAYAFDVTVLVWFQLWFEPVPEPETYGWGTALVFLWTAYMVVAHAIWGRSLGKLVFGLRIVDRHTGGTPALKHVLVRELRGLLILPLVLFPPTVEGAAVGAMLGALWTLWLCFNLADAAMFVVGSRGCSLHDRMAATNVVRSELPRGLFAA
jgi:uncharacterized RDD family membrane protein YckC